MKNINHIVAGEELDIPKSRNLGNQKVRGTHKTAKKIALIAGILSVGWGVAFYPVVKDRIEFRQAFNQAVRQYGDTNRDGFVSPEEVVELFQNIFYKTGITMAPDGTIKYSGSKSIPVSDLTKRIRAYIAHPFPSR